ncbi:hypothetical protein KKH23_08665 [Patescibacteria group bacterium]|nr:hypothetical protein [Patescibacteria group bacterium]MBU0847238.1 hypothetical protein [Patescibacteria group bacterium]
MSDQYHQEIRWIAELIEATSNQVKNPNPVSRLYHTSLAVSLEVMKIMKRKRDERREREINV